MRLQCRCGFDMWNGQVPNDIELWVYSDKRMDEILADDTVSTIELAGRFDYNVWLCPECKRLYVFKGHENNVVYVYKPEELP